MAEVESEAPGHTPVQLGANILSGVLAAFAVEQIAEGAYKVLAENAAVLSGPRIAGVVVTAILLALTLARFYQGNTIYLLTQYAVWDPREVAPGALVTTPVRHLFDVGFHVLEYVALVVAGNLMATDPTLRGPGWALVGLFGLDIVWSAWGVIATKSFDEPPGRGSASRLTRLSWLIINAVATAILLPAVLFYAGALVWLIPLLLIVMAAIDYRLNYDFYFGTPAEPEHIRLSQAISGVTYLAALAQVRAAPLVGSAPREKLQQALDVVFGFFMENSGNVRTLFSRTVARLHAGIYVEQGGELKPVYRIAPDSMRLKQRTFPVGETYVGTAYVKLNQPEQAMIFGRTVQDLAPPEGKSRGKYYKSSVLVNLFWPPSGTERKKIGTLNITSDRQDYFTEGFHEALAVGLASEVVWSMHRVFGDVSAKDVRSKLVDVATAGGVIHTKVSKE